MATLLSDKNSRTCPTHFVLPRQAPPASEIWLIQPGGDRMWSSSLGTSVGGSCAGEVQTHQGYQARIWDDRVHVGRPQDGLRRSAPRVCGQCRGWHRSQGKVFYVGLLVFCPFREMNISWTYPANLKKVVSDSCWAQQRCNDFPKFFLNLKRTTNFRRKFCYFKYFGSVAF